MRTRGIPPLAKPEISRFPRKELPHMPGSWTTPGRGAARAIASVRVAFRALANVGTQVAQVFAAVGGGAGYPAPPPQIPACGLPAPGSCRRSNVIEVRGL